MFFKNKKAMEPIWVVITLVLALVFLGLGLKLTAMSKNSITDAGDEMFSWLNFANPNCDYDHDGINNVNDICPCDDDSDPGSRIYYLQGTQCAVTKRLSVAGKEFEQADLNYLNEKSSTPPAEPSQDNMYVYAINKLVDKKACIKQIEYLANDKGLGSATICNMDALAYKTYYKTTDGAGYSDVKYYGLADFYSDATIKQTEAAIKDVKTNSVLLFPQKCAEKMLAWYKGEQEGRDSRFTFTCKTPTVDCKPKLKDEKC